MSNYFPLYMMIIEIGKKLDEVPSNFMVTKFFFFLLLCFLIIYVLSWLFYNVLQIVLQKMRPPEGKRNRNPPMWMKVEMEKN